MRDIIGRAHCGKTFSSWRKMGRDIVDKISVSIITCDEEKNIERCLKSLHWADEIMVMDSGSKDRTVEICRLYTDKVYHESWHGYGKQKNLCADRASHRWVLNMDADEEVSEECALEIQTALEKGLEQPIYSFPRKNFFGERWVRFGGWYPDRIARLYDKTRVRFSEPQVHEKLVPELETGRFQNPLLHWSYLDMGDYVARQNRYSTLFAKNSLKNGRIGSWSDLIFRPPLAFLKTYFLRQGFREGRLGFFLAASNAFYTYLKYAKTRDPNLLNGD